MDDLLLQAGFGESCDAIAGSRSFTMLHRAGNKLASLILKAPAGGVFHNAGLTTPVVTDGQNLVSRFEVACGTGKYRVTIEPVGPLAAE